jgi:hypothetical protein
MHLNSQENSGFTEFTAFPRKKIEFLRPKKLAQNHFGVRVFGGKARARNTRARGDDRFFPPVVANGLSEVARVPGPSLYRRPARDRATMGSVDSRAIANNLNDCSGYDLTG